MSQEQDDAEDVPDWLRNWCALYSLDVSDAGSCWRVTCTRDGELIGNRYKTRERGELLWLLSERLEIHHAKAH
jgi:hypothetical protein